MAYLRCTCCQLYVLTHELALGEHTGRNNGQAVAKDADCWVLCKPALGQVLPQALALSLLPGH